MMKLALGVIVVLLSQTVAAEKYSGCTDPQYIRYVEKRLAFYTKLDAQKYQKIQRELSVSSSGDTNKKEIYADKNVVLSARFDTEEVAQKNIDAYEAYQGTLFQKAKNLLLGNGGSVHNLNIAKGWLALRAGDTDKAISYLLASTKTKGSPVLNSFGPDKTLIRELYIIGNKDAVLEYLKMSESFWNTDSAKNYMKIWRKMIKNNCPIQFQFYDTASIESLGL